jgi:hypothetical protein
VWRWYPQKADQKLGLGWTGPYLVNWKISEVLYQIQKDPDSRKLAVHVDHLKSYRGENKLFTFRNLYQASFIQ